MRHRPDKNYKWIGHYMDHWSKFHVLFPLIRKCSEEVAMNLQNHVFAVLGTPKILHSDNGREFVNEIVRSVVKDWPGDVTIVNGRPRHPQSQGLVEQGNSTVEKLLGCRFHEYKESQEPNWSEWIPLIQCKNDIG
jgi:transposase InsO family protein